MPKGFVSSKKKKKKSFVHQGQKGRGAFCHKFSPWLVSHGRNLFLFCRRVKTYTANYCESGQARAGWKVAKSYKKSLKKYIKRYSSWKKHHVRDCQRQFNSFVYCPLHLHWMVSHSCSTVRLSCMFVLFYTQSCCFCLVMFVCLCICWAQWKKEGRGRHSFVPAKDPLALRLLSRLRSNQLFIGIILSLFHLDHVGEHQNKPIWHVM